MHWISRYVHQSVRKGPEDHSTPQLTDLFLSFSPHLPGPGHFLSQTAPILTLAPEPRSSHSGDRSQRLVAARCRTERVKYPSKQVWATSDVTRLCAFSAVVSLLNSHDCPVSLWRSADKILHSFPWGKEMSVRPLEQEEEDGDNTRIRNAQGVVEKGRVLVERRIPELTQVRI